ncbi:energy transducer TonB family protein [Methylobacterium sp. P31]
MNPSAAAGTSGGTAVVHFTILRSGAVTGAGLARSSGVGQIDSAALSAVRGSLPPAPPGVTQSSLAITIPSTIACGELASTTQRSSGRYFSSFSNIGARHEECAPSFRTAAPDSPSDWRAC